MTRASYGPEERHLLESSASRIYANAVAHGSLRADDPRLAAGSELRPALDLLVDIGLLRHDDVKGLLFPVDPAAIQSQVVVPLGVQGAELLSESARWADAFSDLGQVFRTSPQAAVSPITEIHGLDNINNFIHAAVNDSRQELLTAQPHGRRPANTLAGVAGPRPEGARARREDAHALPALRAAQPRHPRVRRRHRRPRRRGPHARRVLPPADRRGPAGGRRTRPPTTTTSRSRSTTSP